MSNEQSKNTFIEGGFFPVIIGCIGFIIGLGISTGWFSKLGEIERFNVLFPIVGSIGGGILFFYGALYLRKVLLTK